MYIRLFGALIITASAMTVGFLKAREIQNTNTALFELCIFLEQMKNEIITMRTPIKKIVSQSETGNYKSIIPFVCTLNESLSDLGSRSLSQIWSECTNKTLAFLPLDILNELGSLGLTIGRSEAKLQAQAIDRCILLINTEYEARKRELDNNRKMYIGLTTGAGLILSIIML